VAPDEVQKDLRRQLSSIEYEIVAAAATLDELDDITLDVVVLWEPEPAAIEDARGRGLKTVAIGGAEGADLQLAIDDAASFKTRLWELFRPS
jgi:hypothetical protein